MAATAALPSRVTCARYRAGPVTGCPSRASIRPARPPIRVARCPAHLGAMRPRSCWPTSAAASPPRCRAAAKGAAMAIHTFGSNAVDWEERVDLARLRSERLARLKAQLERSELGGLLSFDMANTRYMTATHIGTWAMDKLIRFALLPR